MVLCCPLCNSFLLIKHGDVSELDGERNHLCLECEANLQPRRPISLYRFLRVIALVLPLPLLLIGIWLVSELIWRYMLLPFLAIGACYQAARLIQQVLDIPMPRKYDTTAFPDARVRLIDLKLRATGEVKPNQTWVGPLSNYVTGVIQAAAAQLATSRRGYKISVQTDCWSGAHAHTLGYRGEPDKRCLERFFEEIEKLPAAAVPTGTIQIEMWFVIRP